MPVVNSENSAMVWTYLEKALRKCDFLPFPVKVGGGLGRIAEALRDVKKARGYRIVVHPQE